MFQFDFMQHSFLSGTAIAILCGVMGVFLRQKSQMNIAVSESVFDYTADAMNMRSEGPTVRESH